MKTIITTYFTFLITLFILVFQSCHRESKFNQEIEENIALDSSILGVSVVADSLIVPWELVWGPDDWIWVVEERGHVMRINPKTGDKKLILKLSIGERPEGAQAMIVHPNPSKFPYVYIHYKKIKADSLRYNILERFTIQKDTLIEPRVILEFVAAKSHSGSRLVLQNDSTILWATGDQALFAAPQDLNSPDGKILRFNLLGEIPADNPFPNSIIYAFGFRNMQGLVVGSNGKVYTSEHGDATEDEINIIKPGGNYGFPIIEGKVDNKIEEEFAATHETIAPLISWTPTIAPAGLDYYRSNTIPEWHNSLLLTMLKGQGLRVLHLNQVGDAIKKEEVFLEKKYGRIRDLCISPDGDVYISTSNHDWNPMTSPSALDDRIIRISKVKKAVKSPIRGREFKEDLAVESGEVLYQKYCFSCHKEKGKGLEGIYPALQRSKVVENNNSFLEILMHGKQNDTYAMPSFKFLSERDLVEIVNYVKNTVNNYQDSVSIKDLTKFK